MVNVKNFRGIIQLPVPRFIHLARSSALFFIHLLFVCNPESLQVSLGFSYICCLLNTARYTGIGFSFYTKHSLMHLDRIG